MQPGQMAYDRAITVFSPDGRLFQVEYARVAVTRGNTTVGLKFKNGIVLMADKKLGSRLVETASIEKIFQIDDHVGAATSGLVADAESSWTMPAWWHRSTRSRTAKRLESTSS